MSSPGAYFNMKINLKPTIEFYMERTFVLKIIIATQ
jgi:hypothetical protein